MIAKQEEEAWREKAEVRPAQHFPVLRVHLEIHS